MFNSETGALQPDAPDSRRRHCLASPPPWHLHMKCVFSPAQLCRTHHAGGAVTHTQSGTGAPADSRSSRLRRRQAAAGGCQRRVTAEAALVAQRSARAQVSHLCRSCCGTWRKWDQEKWMHESRARERNSRLRATHDVSPFSPHIVRHCLHLCLLRDHATQESSLRKRDGFISQRAGRHAR